MGILKELANHSALTINQSTLQSCKVNPSLAKLFLFSFKWEVVRSDRPARLLTMETFI